MRVRAEVPRRLRPRAEAAVAGRPAGRGSGAGSGAGTGERDTKEERETPKADVGEGKGRWALGELAKERGEPRRALEMEMGSQKWALGEAWGGRRETSFGGGSLEGMKGCSLNEQGSMGSGGAPKWRGSYG